MYTYVPYMPYIYTYVLHTHTQTHTHTHTHTHNPPPEPAQEYTPCRVIARIEEQDSGF